MKKILPLYSERVISLPQLMRAYKAQRERDEETIEDIFYEIAGAMVDKKGKKKIRKLVRKLNRAIAEDALAESIEAIYNP